MTPVAVRQTLVHALSLDLIGPTKGSPLEAEVLAQSPSRWYLTGFLVPFDADEEQRVDETVTEEVSEVSDAAGLDDAVTPEPAAARRAFFPSSMGLSLLVSDKTEKLQVTVRWGDYRAHTEPADDLVTRKSQSYHTHHTRTAFLPSALYLTTYEHENGSYHGIVKRPVEGRGQRAALNGTDSRPGRPEGRREWRELRVAG
jgi:hypothetical protein